jgi:Fic family protein
MRKYERSHPWLRFQLDLQRATPQFWLLLGEAQSKSQHVVGTPLVPAVQRSFQLIYLAKGVRATTAIEGNTLTEAQVEAHLRHKLRLPPSQRYLQQEIENVVGACNEVVEAVLRGERTSLALADILDFNRRVLDRLPPQEDVSPGRVREHEVVVSRYPGAPPQDCEYLLQRLCTWLNEQFTAPAGHEIAFGILKAVVAHLYIAWIHPFGDGNGRTARLIEFQLLISAGVPTTAAHLLSNHYNQTREEYYRQLDLAHRSHGDALPFLEYAVRGFIDGLREQIHRLREQQIDVCWRDYVHSRFQGRRKDADKRKRDLALAISTMEGGVPIERLSQLTPDVAALYARKSHKTLLRDLKELAEMELIEASDRAVRARKETMRAFMSRVAPPSSAAAVEEG